MDDICIKSPIPDKWDTTRMEIMKFKYMWTISNFSYFWNNTPGEYIDSPIFSTGMNDKIKWHLRLYPNGSDDGNIYDYTPDCSNVALYLYLKTRPAPRIEAKCKFSIINNRREEINIKSSRYCHRSVDMTDPERFTGLAKFIRRDFLIDPNNGLLPNDTLTILCEIRACKGIINILGLSIPKQLMTPRSQCDDLGALLESEEFSDVSIIVGCREFKVHKAILAARSPVFLAMFKHNMKEKTESIVEIDDIDERVMRELLRFIYAERVDRLQEFAHDLLAAAEKYSLDGLKIMCEETLCGKLTIHNAADVLALADMYNADCLKTQVINFLVAHGKDPSIWTKYLNSANSKTSSLLTGCSEIFSNYIKLLIILALCMFIVILLAPYFSFLVDPMCDVTAKICTPHKDIVTDADTISIALKKLQKSASSFMEDLYAFISYFIRLILNCIVNPFPAEPEFHAGNEN
ncbi:speckle-type POZ protein-like [Phymastichus coffea]|uniref:speckle-type POZ protein-like n=1 Tax=Phymastichus coffea TaxID=108790 RepID=UPI00273C2A6A|nr:speckle-type POZ protein-like [Phymastichus coffea]XP_058788569.1 speckle-type POZ protein-like [Phymastichus coffea]